MGVFDTQETLDVVLNFKNNGANAMLSTEKLCGKLANSLHDLVEDALKAGHALNAVSDAVRRIEPGLDRLHQQAATLGLAPEITARAKRWASFYQQPARLQQMSDNLAARQIKATNDQLGKQLGALGSKLDRLISDASGRRYPATGKRPYGTVAGVDFETHVGRAEVKRDLDSYRKSVAQAMAEATIGGLKQALASHLPQLGQRQSDPYRELQHGLDPLKAVVKDFSIVLHKFSKDSGNIGPELKRITLIADTMGRFSAQQLRIAEKAFRRSDFVVSHHQPQTISGTSREVRFDPDLLRRLFPNVAMQHLSSIADIPHRVLGQPGKTLSRRSGSGTRTSNLQDLLRILGIDPGEAHTSDSDTRAMMQLLRTVPPQGINPYSSYLLGPQRPDMVSRTGQYSLGLIRKLSSSYAAGRPPQSPRSRTPVGGLLPPPGRLTDEQDILRQLDERAQHVAGEFRSPTARGKIDSYRRELALMSGPYQARELLQIITGQAQFQQNRQSVTYTQRSGRARFSNDNPEELSMAGFFGGRQRDIPARFYDGPRKPALMKFKASGMAPRLEARHRREGDVDVVDWREVSNTNTAGSQPSALRSYRGSPRSGEMMELATMVGTHTQLENQRNPQAFLSQSTMQRKLAKIQHEREMAALSTIQAFQSQRQSLDRTAYVFDIDKTLLSGIGVPKDLPGFRKRVAEGNLPAIPVGKELYDEAIAGGHEVHMITARGAALREATIRNLQAAGMGQFTSLTMPPYQGGWDTYEQVAQHKAGLRRYLEQSGVRVLKNVGDAETDFRHGWFHEGAMIKDETHVAPFDAEWANVKPVKPTGYNPIEQFTPEAVRSFISNPARHGDIRTAAEMMSFLGPAHPLSHDLNEIISGTQKKNKAARDAKRLEELRAKMGAPSTLTPSKGLGSKFRELMESEEGTQQWGETFWWLNDKLFGKRKARQNVQDRLDELSGKKKAGGPTPRSYSEEAARILSTPGGVESLRPGIGDIRGQIRFEKLAAALEKLTRSAQDAGSSLERYKKGVDRRSGDVEASAALRQAEISRQHGLTTAGIGIQRQSIEAHGRVRSAAAAERIFGIEEAANVKGGALTRARLDAEMKLEQAVARADIRRAAIAEKAGVNWETHKGTEPYIRQLEAMVAGPKQRYMRAQFEEQVAGMTDPAQIAQARASFAHASAIARYGDQDREIMVLDPATGTMVPGTTQGARVAHEKAMLDSLVGRTSLQKYLAKGNLARSAESEAAGVQASRLGVLSEKQTAADERAGAARVAAERSRVSKLQAIWDQWTNRRVKGEATVSKAQEQAHAKVKSYLMDQAAREGGKQFGRGAGGGGRATSLAGGGGQNAFMLGITALGFYDYGKHVLGMMEKATKYAAEVEALQVTTRHIARYNALDVNQVQKSIDSVRGLEMTTESATKLVQRMIFTQLDVSKAPQLARVAQNLSMISGGTPSQTLDKIITGLQTGLTISLHRMGLPVSMVSATREAKLELAAHGEKREPTETEKREALMEQVLMVGARASGAWERSLATAGGQAKLLGQRLEELQYVVGKQFIPMYGQAISMLSEYTKSLIKHPEAVRGVASSLGGLTAGIGVIGGAALAQMAFRAGAFNPYVVAGAILTALFTKAALMHFTPEGGLISMTGQASEAGRVNLRTLEQERTRLQRPGAMQTDEWKKQWQLNAEAIAAAKENILGTAADLREGLADNYAKIKSETADLDKVLSGRMGFWEQAWAHTKLVWGTALPGTDAETHRRHALEVSARALGMTPEQFEKYSDEREQRRKDEELHPGITNQNQKTAQGVAQALAQATAKLHATEERLGAQGSAGRKFRTMYETPENKIRLETEMSNEGLDVLKQYRDIQKASLGTGKSAIDAKIQLDYIEEELGGKKNVAQLDKIMADTQEENQANAAAAFLNLNRQTQEYIRGVHEQVEVQTILGNVIQGNSASEKAGAESVLAVHKKYIAQIASESAQQKATADAKAEYDLAEIQRVQRLVNVKRQLAEGGALFEAKMVGEAVLRGTGGTQGETEAAYSQSFQVRRNAVIDNVSDEGRRMEELQRIDQEEREARARRLLNRSRTETETQVSSFQSMLDVQQEMGNILAPRKGRMTDFQAGAQSIRRNLVIAQSGIEHQFNAMLPHAETPEEAERMRLERNANLIKVELQSKLEMVKLAKEQADAEGEALAERMRRTGEVKAARESGLAVSKNQEIVAAQNVYELRMSYIKAEKEARKNASGDTLKAEVAAAKEVADAEMQRLQEMLSQRKEYISGLHQFGEELFQTITTDHARGLRDMLLGKVKGMGATVFGNIFAMATQNTRWSLPGLTTKDKEGKTHLTKLGEILSRTLPGTKVATQKEIENQVQVANDAARQAEDKNTEALQALTTAVEDLQEAIDKLSGDYDPGSYPARRGNRIPGPDLTTIGLPAGLGLPPPVSRGKGPGGLAGLLIYLSGRRGAAAAAGGNQLLGGYGGWPIGVGGGPGVGGGGVPSIYSPGGFNVPWSSGGGYGGYGVPWSSGGGYGGYGVPWSSGGGYGSYGSSGGGGESSGSTFGSTMGFGMPPMPRNPQSAAAMNAAKTTHSGANALSTYLGQVADSQGIQMPPFAMPGFPWSSGGGYGGYGVPWSSGGGYGSYGSSGGGGESSGSTFGSTMGFGMPPMPRNPQSAAAMNAAMQKMGMAPLSTFAAKTTHSGANALSTYLGQVADSQGIQMPPFAMPGFPWPKSGGGGKSSGSGNLPGNPIGGGWAGAMGALPVAGPMGVMGVHQAVTNVGKGARGDIFATAGGLQAAAAIAMMIPGGQAVAAALGIAALVGDLVGGLFQDPRQARANQVQNYLGLSQYLAPTPLALTTDLQGNLVSEGRGGTATDTGIGYGNVKVTSPYLLQGNPNIGLSNLFTNPYAYLTGKPSSYQVPGFAYNNPALAAAMASSGTAYSYQQVPGQVNYNNLPGEVQPSMNMTLNINALDSKSILDRAPDISAAVQAQLALGSPLSTSIQNAVFGVP